MIFTFIFTVNIVPKSITVELDLKGAHSEETAYVGRQAGEQKGKGKEITQLNRQ